MSATNTIVSVGNAITRLTAASTTISTLTVGNRGPGVVRIFGSTGATPSVDWESETPASLELYPGGTLANWTIDQLFPGAGYTDLFAVSDGQATAVAIIHGA